MLKRTTITLVFILLFASLPVFAAEIDLSSLSYDELVALRDKIDLALWNSKEWREVTVPKGVYEIGKDIPEGRWTITIIPGYQTSIWYGDKLKKTETALDGYIDQVVLTSKENRFYDPYDCIESIGCVLVAGSYIDIESANVIFTPYAGKPSLGFK